MMIKRKFASLLTISAFVATAVLVGPLPASAAPSLNGASLNGASLN